MSNERFLTTAELAQMAGVQYYAIAKLCARKGLPAIKKGKAYLIPRHAARAFLRVVDAQKRLREMADRFYSEDTP